MNYDRFRKIFFWISVVTLAILLIGSASSFAEEKRTIYEKRRNSIPLDKLKVRLEDPKREEKMQPARVIEVFGVKKGESIADVGAGTGFFAFRLANTVGAEGKVYAVEIEDELLDYIRNKMEQNKVTNIIPVKSSDTDANLPPASCDKILLVNSYAYFSDPIGFMKALRKALKPGGTVGVIDLDEDKVAEKRKAIKKPLPPHVMKQGELKHAKDVVDEMKLAGFTLQASHDFLDTRHFLIFSVTP